MTTGQFVTDGRGALLVQDRKVRRLAEALLLSQARIIKRLKEAVHGS